MVYYHYNLEQLMNNTTWITHINLKAIVLKVTNNFESIIKFLGVMFNKFSLFLHVLFITQKMRYIAWNICKSGSTCTVHEFIRPFLGGLIA